MSAGHRLAWAAAAALLSACAAAPKERAPEALAEPQLIATPPLPPPRLVATQLERSEAFDAAARALDAEMRRWLKDEGAARRDGWLYGMDVAPMLLYAARRADRELYLSLLPLARKLVRLDDSDPYTRGFVLWRARGGARPDVSGAAEAQWLARALWEGAQVFGREEDRALARTILDGYARHAWEQDGIWIVRKYFSFAGRGFASLSSITGYAPDFLADVAAARGGPWAELSQRSYAALERARTDGALLAPLLQPEVAATWPEISVAAYAPNGIASLLDSCLGAEGAVRGRPAMADALLDFARDRDHRATFGRLYAYFRTHDGEPAGIAELSTTGYACLARLAAAREDEDAFESLQPTLALAMRDIARVPSLQVAPLHDGGALLLAAHAAGAFGPPER